jgi:D-arabinose 1-dehydrogenase-like Zn-dependent alcohol dehydrogenase
MKAMVLNQPNHPLSLQDIPIPTPGPHQLLLRVLACGVCRTHLHIYDGDLDQPKLPLILGHEIVGRVEAVGANVTEFQVGAYRGWALPMAPAATVSADRRTCAKTLNLPINSEWRLC